MELYILWILIICIKLLVKVDGKQILQIVIMKNGSLNGQIKITVCLASYSNILEENRKVSVSIQMMWSKKNSMKFVIAQ